MIAQAELTPFFREQSRKADKEVLSAPKFNEMHLYALPWPVHALQELGAEDVELPAEEDPDWLFGAKSVAAGSVHCDIWRGPAASLALRDLVGVVPVAGWWKNRVGARRYDSKIRYSIVVSITTADREVQLYSEVQQRIETTLPITIAVET